MTQSPPPSVAAIILHQLGGQRFIAITGARNLVSAPDMLTFRVPRGRSPKGAVNAVRITLDATDTYTMVAFYIRGTKVTEIDRRADIYADKLREVFESMTGLRTAWAW